MTTTNLKAQVKDAGIDAQLLEAVLSNDYPKIEPFLNSGAKLNSIDADGNTVFHKAILSHLRIHFNDKRTIEELYRLGFSVGQANHAGRTPIHVLCAFEPYQPFLSDLRWWLSLTRDIDATDHDGATPLHLASIHSDHLVDELIQLGADVTKTTSEGLTALHLAARARQSNIVGTLLESLHNAQPDRVQYLKLVNRRDNEGRTALHCACRSGRPETVSLLLKAGADPTIEDAKQSTAMEACVEFESEQQLWKGSRRMLRDEHCALLSAPLRKSIWKESVTEPPEFICTDEDTTRLSEILDMVASVVANLSPDTAQLKEMTKRCIRIARASGHEYTVKCFLRLLNKYDSGVAPKSPSKVDA